MIDLRSDTVTKPTPAMKEFMFNAEVGDDVFEDGGTDGFEGIGELILIGDEGDPECGHGRCAW